MIQQRLHKLLAVTPDWWGKLSRSQQQEYVAAHPKTRITRRTKDEMIANGADGALAHGYDRYIPLDKLDGMEPVPANTKSKSGKYQPGIPVTQPIEVVYDALNNKYIVHGGNHRIAQAHANQETHVRAYIESDAGKIGAVAKREHPDWINK